MRTGSVFGEPCLAWSIPALSSPSLTFLYLEQAGLREDVLSTLFSFVVFPHLHHFEVHDAFRLDTAISFMVRHARSLQFVRVERLVGCSSGAMRKHVEFPLLSFMQAPVQLLHFFFTSSPSLPRLQCLCMGASGLWLETSRSVAHDIFQLAASYEELNEIEVPVGVGVSLLRRAVETRWTGTHNIITVSISFEQTLSDTWLRMGTVRVSSSDRLHKLIKGCLDRPHAVSGCPMFSTCKKCESWG